ncbi:hypothetical protein [Marinobacter alexandrii]|uniref:hypothetical protein n=1 Tax=Marinobacter alexandrii TaxID=2570351 RepID=UPI001FFF8B63|nr:hypothetical protein [Marinobacter alexandrii]
MLLKKLKIIVVVSLVSVASHVHAQSVATTLLRGKQAFEFVEAAIANPQQLIALALGIEGRFRMQGNYEGLDNQYAQDAGWFVTGPAGLDHIEVASEPTKHQRHANYSITLRKLTFKECEVLSNYVPFNAHFVSVELNGDRVSSKRNHVEDVLGCENEWFFQDGKNTIKYVGR